MKKVLIISYHFPPVNNIASRRFGEMVSFMPNFGWEPFVLTTKSKGTLPVLIPEKKIIRIGNNYYSENKLVSEEGYKGISNIFKPLYSLYKKFGIKFWSIDRFLFSWGKEVIKNIDKIKSINPDLILVTFDPAVSLWLGNVISKKNKRPLAIDFRDPCSMSNASKFPFVKSLDKKIDKFLSNRAVLITTVSQKIATKLEKFYKKPVEVVFNGFNLQNLKTDKFKKEKKQQDNTVIYYAGRFHSHRLPAVKLLIDWISKNSSKNFQLILRSLGPESANNEILEYAKEKKVYEKIKLLNPEQLNIIYQEEKKADILILFEDLSRKPSTLQLQGALPGKLFEYLPLEAPILAIAWPESEIGVVLKDTSRGYLVSDIKELDFAITKITNGSMLEPKLDKIREYSRESQCKNLCNLLDKALKNNIEK